MKIIEPVQEVDMQAQTNTVRLHTASLTSLCGLDLLPQFGLFIRSVEINLSLISP